MMSFGQISAYGGRCFPSAPEIFQNSSLLFDFQVRRVLMTKHQMILGGLLSVRVTRQYVARFHLGRIFSACWFKGIVQRGEDIGKRAEPLRKAECSAETQYMLFHYGRALEKETLKLAGRVGHR